MNSKQHSWLLIFCCSFLFQFANAQPGKSRIAEEDILKIYERQLAAGYVTRGMSILEITTYMEKGKDGISSLQDVAEELQSVFPENLQDKIAVLFFFFNHDSLYRYFIVPGAIREKKIIPIKKYELEKLNTDVYNALNIYDLVANRAPRKRGLKPAKETTSAKISFANAIKNATTVLLPESFDSTYQHLVIVPSFSIGTFPFQLLQPYKDSSYLIDKCSFSIAPSLLDLFAIRKRIINKYGQNIASTTFSLEKPLFVCNPKYPTNTEYIFPNLPGAKKEITNTIPFVKQYTLFEGANATKINIINKIMDCDVIYFATHAMSAEKNPLDNNFLVLSGNTDPFLTSRNIMALRDTTYSDEHKFPELVILSACQTGLGRSMEAGITGGLARSFLIAGANQVIMSLWSVDDEATAYLMNRFVYYLQKPNLFVPSEPLRLAELDTKKKFPHPSQWASFSVYGITY